MAQTIVITGATGFLGSRLAERLATMPAYRCITTGRRPETRPRLPGDSSTFLQGDLTDAAFTRQLIQPGTDVLIHCAALSSPWGSYADFYRANVVATENLLASAIQAGVQRIVHISTPSIYFDYTDRFDIREDDPLPARLVNHYATTKLMAEERVRASGIPHIILRPRAIIGAGDTVIMPRLIRTRRENRLRIVGNGQNTVNVTPVSNLIDAILLSLDAPAPALNQAYNITNPPVLLWPFISDVLSKINLPLTPKYVPYLLLDTLARVSELTANLFGNGREPVITRYAAGILAKSCTLNTDKARDLLGYVPQQTVEAAIDEFATWYNQQPVCP